jgi:site-specific DNA-methyltransferase (adenine-specific)
VDQLPMFAVLRTSNRKVQNGIPELEDAAVDVALFSPPYHHEDGYSDELLFETGRLLARVLKPGARAWMNFGRVSEAPGREYNARAALLEGAGEAIQPAQDFIWVKSIAVGGWKEVCPNPECGTEFVTRTVCRGHVTPLNSERIVNNGFEHIFQFTKGPASEANPYDRLAVGVEYADPGNLSRGSRGKNGNLRCRGDTVFLPYKTTGPASKKAHRHSFPAALVRHFLQLSKVPEGGLVLDPFSGGGTTAAVARSLGLNAFVNDVDAQAIEETKAAWARVEELVKKRAEAPAT